MGHLGSRLGHSRSLTPQSPAGSPQVSMSTIATYCSFVNIAAAAWETERESPSFFSLAFFVFLLLFFFLFSFFKCLFLSVADAVLCLCTAQRQAGLWHQLAFPPCRFLSQHHSPENLVLGHCMGISLGQSCPCKLVPGPTDSSAAETHPQGASLVYCRGTVSRSWE